ncbi:MAG: glycosyl transferase family protein [Ilumatobacteraceae bacterium]|nr:glycosyl transferase family protein [Ilumatobacteraceae bacterium]
MISVPSEDQTGAERSLEVTVLVCTRDRGDSIQSTVRSILASRHKSFELLVIDQSSDTATSSALSHYKDDGRLSYVQSKSAGLSIARNLGLELARGDVVLMTDDDCEVPSDWLEVMQEALNRYSAVALVFCSVVSGPFDADVGFIPGRLVSDVLIGAFSRRELTLGIGAGMGLRRSAALAAGGFDPLLGAGAFFRGGEEHDLAYRLLLKGEQIYCISGTEVVHHGFRTHGEGGGLISGYMLGYGAVLAKLVRCRIPGAATLYIASLWRHGLGPLLANVVRRQRPFGARRAAYFILGFVRGLHAPLDKTLMLYRTRTAGHSG